MRQFSVVLVFFIIWGLLPGEILAQAGRYNTATVQTISGHVTLVETLAGKGGVRRTRLQVSTPEGVFLVSLGPAQFIQQQNFPLVVGDLVTVIGSQVGGRKRSSSIIAASVQKGDKILRLRDPAGVPLWRGKRDIK
jgi:hypothetical protein